MLSKGKILTNKGTLTESGISLKELKEYNKEQVPFIYRNRIKEWDYYSFMNDEFAFLLTIANNTYMSYISCSFINLIDKKYVTKSYINILNPSKFALPKTPSIRDIEINDSKYYINIKNVENKTKILAKLNYFVHKMDLILNIDVEHNAQNNSLFILHPFKNKHQFYYNFKENLLTYNGYFKLGETKKEFNGYGCFDWGRGIWPYKTEWFWITSSTIKDSVLKGFNLGCGFGEAKENENIAYFNDKNYKLSNIKLDIPKNNKGKIDYYGEWKITSETGDIELTFTPIVNRKDTLNLLILSTKQNQVFGRFNGVIKTDKSLIKVENELGFIEHFQNRW